MQSQELGDYIGAESCVDFRPDVANITSHGGSGMNHRRRSDAVEKRFPPSIPLLARTENLPSHMAWVMKKYSTSDGRVVIKEERVRRHEYFQAHRSNGRLVLNLVPIDDDAVEESCREHRAGDEGEEKFDFTENVEVSGEEINGGDEGMSDSTAEEVHCESNNYNVIKVNPCGGFGVARVVAEFRPAIHT